VLLSGAKPEVPSGAHYPLPQSAAFANYGRTFHRQRMAAFEGVPLLLEEDTSYKLLSMDNSGWYSEDGLTDRHPGSSGGTGNIGYLDCHVGRFKWPKRYAATPLGKYMNAEHMCIRTSGNKWVSGKSWVYEGMYGFLDVAQSADTPDKNPDFPLKLAGGGGLTH